MIQVLGFLLGIAAFPCFLEGSLDPQAFNMVGIIMLVSFLTCDYIEKFVVKTFCSIKNRRRRYRERSIPIAGHSGKKRKKSHSSSEMATKDNETPAVSQGQGPNVSQNVLGTPGTHSQSFVFDEPPPAYYECTRTQTSQSGHKAKNE